MEIKNYQIFADAAVMSADIEPAISYDYATRLATNLDALREVLGIQALRSMSNGTQLKIYAMDIDKKGDQPAEGAVIPLTHITRKLVRTIDLAIKKYRKETTVDAIQVSGRQNALNATDDKLVNMVQNETLTAFYDALTTGEKIGTAKGGATLQAALSSAWAAVRKRFKEFTATPIYFVSVDDVADYLGTANPVLATTGGMTYIENFLSLGTVVISPEIPAGFVFATAKENLAGAYVPTGGEVGTSVGVTADVTGLVGIKHYVANDTANVGTLLLSGIKFFAEYEDGIFKAPITAPATPATPSASAAQASGK